MGQSSRRQLCWYNPQAWYRKLLFITVHLLVVIPICKMFGSFRFFQHHHSKCRINLFLPLLFVSLPICIWVDMPPKREKSRKKWQNIFLKLYFAWCSWQNDASSCFSFSRTRVRARLPTAMLIFCCHKCHTRGKFGGKNRANFGGRKKEKNDFWSSFQPIFSLWNSCLLKYVWKYVVMDWIIVCCLLFCDTCDSKNAKTPVMRVYAHAWEWVFHYFFTLRDVRMMCAQFLLLSWVCFCCCGCLKNNPSFYRKWRVVL